MRGLLHALAVRAGMSGCPVAVVDAEADDRPAVIRNGANHVQLVTALRAVLGGRVQSVVAGAARHGDEDLLDAGEPIVLKPTASHGRRRAGTIGRGFEKLR